MNFVVRFLTWDSYNCKTADEAIKKCKKEHGENIEVLSCM